LEKAAGWGWVATPTVALLALAVVLLALWTHNELRVDQPLVELRLLRRRAVLTANVSGLVLGIAMYLGVSLNTVVQFPTGIDQTVFVAGLTLLPVSALSTISSRLVPIVRRSVGPHGVIPAGSVAIAVGMLFRSLTGRGLWQAFLTMSLVGLGLGLTFYR
jgi:hypothetical protein